jgi:hypothetical protein
VESAVIPYNTPIFTIFPVLNRQAYRFQDRSQLDQDRPS